MKKKIEKVDPTMPFTPITIDGTDYKMCFDHDALAMGEEKLIAQGHDANLLFRCPPFTFGNLRILFAVSLMHYQPDTDFAEAKKLVTYENRGEILAAVMVAWKMSMPEADPDEDKQEKADPQQPEQEPGE